MGEFRAWDWAFGRGWDLECAELYEGCGYPRILIRMGYGFSCQVVRHHPTLYVSIVCHSVLFSFLLLASLDLLSRRRSALSSLVRSSFPLLCVSSLRQCFASSPTLALAF